MKIIENEYVFPLNDMSCHASTLLVFENGDVLISFFMGTAEGNSDVCIYTAKKKCGNNFSAPQKVSLDDGIPHWNPVLEKINEKEIILFYKVGLTPSTWHTEFMVSYDDGDTFSAPETLVANDDVSAGGPVRNKMIKMTNGEWLAPSSSEESEWKCFMDISSDGCKTWSRSEYICLPKNFGDNSKNTIQSNKGVIRGIIQPTVWESENGRIHALMRSTEGWIFRSDSTDYGRHWGAPYPIEIENNNSGIDIAQAKDKILYLVCNPCGNNGKLFGPRTPLSLFKSVDNGETFEFVSVIASGNGTYAYPCIVTENQFLHISYTWNRKLIYYTKIYIGLS